jgi:hypothetical protein
MDTARRSINERVGSISRDGGVLAGEEAFA